MELSLLIIAVISQSISVVYNWSCLISTNDAVQREQRQDKLRYLKRTRAQFVSCPDFTPPSLETLKDRLKEFCCTARKLEQRIRLKEEHVRSLREEFMTTFQMEMNSAVFEVVMELYKRNIKPSVTEKQVVEAILDHVQNWECPKLHAALSSFGKSTKTLPELLSDVMDLNLC